MAVEVPGGFAETGAVVLLDDGQIAGFVLKGARSPGRVAITPASRISEFVRQNAR